MKTGKLILIGLCISMLPLSAGEPLEIEHDGELRLGAIQTEDNGGRKRTTLSLGGRVTLESQPLYGVGLVGSFFTTNPLFKKDNEGMFLDSQNRGYAVVGESYLKFNRGNTLLKIGRQLVNTPYADSDDVAMVPNSFEGYTLVNRDIASSTIFLGLLDRWSGVDAPTPERFTYIQDSKDSLFTAGLIYQGLKDSTFELWHYRLDGSTIEYVELAYDTGSFNMALQYTNQDNDNSAYGFLVGGEVVKNLSLSMGYNRADGVVTNGFGGGPFFTSSEEHTIADIKDQKAKMMGIKYSIDKFLFGVSHVNFDRGEDETDYLASFEVGKNGTIDIIYSDIYNDGKMVRFFANYKF